MSFEQRGKYIVLLCLQHQQGYLTDEDMKNICKTYDAKIYSKFIQAEDGFYYNERMKIECEKRKKYSDSRRQNRTTKTVKEDNICETYDEHMENENILINKGVLLKKRETEFKESVRQFSNQYSVTMLKSFCDYWTEPNKSKTKMRFELEKTFEIGRRLVTWSSRDKTFAKSELQTEPSYYKPLPKL
jgi:hypothetical protein